MIEFWSWKPFDLYLLGLPAVVFILIYIYLDRTYTYWTRRDVPQVNPSSYIYGNCKDMFYGKEYGGIGYQKIYYQLKGHPIGGFYEFVNPVLMVRDPELIHTVLVEKFSHFHDNKFNYDKNHPDDAAKTHPFLVKGSRWKEVRSLVNSGFTPNKLRNLEDIVRVIYKDMSKYLEKINLKNIEANDVSRRFMTEVVANWGWGIYANAFADNSVIRNIFDKLNVSALTSSFLYNIWTLWPKVGNLLNKRFFSEDLNRCLEYLTEEAMKNSKSNTYLQTILSKKEKYKTIGTEKDFSVTDTTGYMAAYYMDGYDTVSAFLNLVFYQLAIHSDVQHNLRDEIMNRITADITVDAVSKLEYMDMVLSEVGRKHPVVSYLGRICTEKITLGSAEIEPGTSVIIPLYAIHHDPEYFPDPNNFNPENFSEENRNRRHKFTFLPFGEGPRICLGRKHTLITVKLLLCYLLKEYEILPPEGKIADPLKPEKGSIFLYIPESEPIVRFKKLNI